MGWSFSLQNVDEHRKSSPNVLHPIPRETVDINQPLDNSHRTAINPKPHQDAKTAESTTNNHDENHIKGPHIYDNQQFTVLRMPIFLSCTVIFPGHGPHALSLHGTSSRRIERDVHVHVVSVLIVFCVLLWTCG